MSDFSPNFVPGSGNRDAKLAIVGMAPGPEENERLEGFVGPSGDLLWEMMAKCGIKRSDVYISNVEKYMPPDNMLSRFKEIGRKPLQDLDLLRRELSGEACSPNAVLALGEHAFKALTGKKKIPHQRGSVIQNWRGSIVESNLIPNLKVIGSYHPSALLRSRDEETKAFSYSARAYMQNDFGRAVAQSKFPDFRLPKRTLQYAESAEQAEAFFKLYEGLKIVSCDIETTRGTCIPTCIGFAFNHHHGLSIPLLNVGGNFRITSVEQLKLIHLVQKILGDESFQLIGANWKFDRRKLYKPFAFNIRALTYHDVGMANHILYPEFPKSVQFLTSVWTEEPYYKDELAEYDPQIHDFTQILEYNAKDVCVPFEIYEKQVDELEERHLDEFFYNEVMPLSDFYQAIEDRGLAFDPNIRDEVRRDFIARRDELKRNIDAIAGYEVDIGSTRKVAKLLFDELGLSRRKDTKESTLVQLLGQCKNDPSKQLLISDLIDIRKINRNLSGPLASPPDYDGRMRTMFNINATVVGRTGNNLVKPPERPTILGQQFQNQSKHGEIGPEIRRMYHPDPGKIFLQIDMSQADARIVAALAKDEWRLKVFALKKDIHAITASWYFGKENPESDMDPIGVTVDERFIGKTTGHALSYFCQWKKLQLTVNMYARRFGFENVNVTAAECKGFRSIFLHKSPKIESIFWYDVLEVMKKTKTQVAASGRTRTFFGWWNPADFFPYIPAASVTDHNKASALALSRRRPDLEILKEDHDSILLQCEEKELPEIATIAREEYEKPVDLSRCSLPRDPIIIPCDFEVGYNYKDLEKWKLTASMSA